MMRNVLAIILAAAMAVALTGCGGPSQTRALSANEFWLPADPGLVLGPGATPQACAGIGTDAVLRGSATDPRHVWLDDAISGGRFELVWPTGYSVRFGQQGFDVLNASGTVAIVGGSHVNGACVGANNTYWLDSLLW